MRLDTRLRLGLHRLRGAWRQAATRRREQPHLDAFRKFHRSLENPRGVFYMFFTTGLLHWVDRALRFVPDHVPVVLLGSGLSDEELEWLEGRTSRPWHHITTRVDDNTALDFVFEVSEHDFGWLHVDCFVLNPELFAEMRDLDPKVAMNCIWSHPESTGFRALHSAFVFFNQDALWEVRRRGLSASPLAHHYAGKPEGRTPGSYPLYSRVPSSREVELLKRILPVGDDGLPEYPHGGDYFQVLVLYQAVTEALGYRQHHVRDLLRDGTGSAAHYSNEIIHVNGVATYRQYKQADGTLGSRFYPLLLQADFTMLDVMSGAPPRAYRELHGELAAELDEMGLSPEQVKQNLYGFLRERGIDDARCARILQANGK